MRYFEMRKARIEIIPMIDIMLFLLVFFIMVTLLEDGEIEVDDQKLSLDQLTGKLAGEPNPAETDVTIAGAAHASLQNLLDVMDACRKAGVTHLGIAARDKS